MEIFTDSPALTFLIIFLLFYIVMSWIDANSDKSFFESIMEIKNTKQTSQKETSSEQDKQTIAELKERVAVLERIITDNRFELDQKLSKL